MRLALLLLVTAAVQAQTVYVRRCAVCHGADGRGGERAPGIVSRLPALSDAALEKLIRTGLPGMPPVPLPPEEMQSLLTGAGFRIVETHDSTGEGQAWFEAMAARMASGAVPAVTFQTFLGNDFPEMGRNQVKNLKERRIRTVTYICEA